MSCFILEFECTDVFRQTVEIYGLCMFRCTICTINRIEIGENVQLNQIMIRSQFQ
jgi:hypothetical protein